MAKYYGRIGFIADVETKPDVWKKLVTVKYYKGDVIRNSRRYEPSDKLNDNLNINNEISIVADAYAYQNFHTLGFAEFMGTFWKVTNVTVEHPRLILTLGGVYNGPTS